MDGLPGGRRLLPPLALAAGALLLAAIIVDVARPKGTFDATPEFLIWLVLFVVQLFVWLAVLAFAVREGVSRLGDLSGVGAEAAAYRGSLWRDAVAIAVLAVFGVVAILPGLGIWRDGFPGDIPWIDLPLWRAFGGLPECGEWPFELHCWVFGITTLAGLVVALLAVGVMFLVRRQLLTLAINEELTPARFEKFDELRNDLLRFVAMAGVTLGIGTLVLAAFQNAAGAQDERPFYTEFDFEYVLLFGLYFSALLALAYAPAHRTMIWVGEELVRRTMDDVEDDPNKLPAEQFCDRREKRENLRKALELNAGTVAVFKGSVAIFTPLFGSLVGGLLK